MPTTDTKTKKKRGERQERVKGQSCSQSRCVVFGPLPETCGKYGLYISPAKRFERFAIPPGAAGGCRHLGSTGLKNVLQLLRHTSSLLQNSPQGKVAPIVKTIFRPQ